MRRRSSDLILVEYKQISLERGWGPLLYWRSSFRLREEFQLPRARVKGEGEGVVTTEPVLHLSGLPSSAPHSPFPLSLYSFSFSFFPTSRLPPGRRRGGESAKPPAPRPCTATPPLPSTPVPPLPSTPIPSHSALFLSPETWGAPVRIRGRFRC